MSDEMTTEPVATEQGTTEAESPGKKSASGRRLLVGALGFLVLLTIFNTVALFRMGSAGSKPEEPGPQEEPTATEEPAAMAAAANESPEPPTPEPVSESSPSLDESELTALLFRAEEQMTETERVHGYLFFANAYRKLHKRDLASETGRKAGKALADGLMSQDLGDIGMNLLESGEHAKARRALYLLLCRSARYPGESPARAYFGIAESYTREAMAALELNPAEGP